MLSRLKRYTGVVALAAIIVLVVIGVMRAVLASSSPLVVVEGNSMIPTLYNGDLVLIQKPAPSELHRGDIIVYRSPVTGRLVIHRVVKINVEHGSYFYITKGDNNPVDDVAQGLEPPRGIPYEDILGRVVCVHTSYGDAPLRIPYLGLLTQLVRG